MIRGLFFFVIFIFKYPLAGGHNDPWLTGGMKGHSFMQKPARSPKLPSPSKYWPVSIKDEVRALKDQIEEQTTITSSAPSWHKSDVISCWQFACVFIVVLVLHQILWHTWLEVFFPPVFWWTSLSLPRTTSCILFTRGRLLFSREKNKWLSLPRRNFRAHACRRGP